LAEIKVFIVSDPACEWMDRMDEAITSRNGGKRRIPK
jgi:hypothetical protein